MNANNFSQKFKSLRMLVPKLLKVDFEGIGAEISIDSLLSLPEFFIFAAFLNYNRCTLPWRDFFLLVFTIILLFFS